MRGLTSTGYALAVCAAAFVFAACGGSQAQQSNPSVPPQKTAYSVLGPATEKKSGQVAWVWQNYRVSPSGSINVTVHCPSNYAVTGGGYSFSSPNGFLTAQASAPNSSLDGWAYRAVSGYSGAISVTVFAGCVLQK